MQSLFLSTSFAISGTSIQEDHEKQNSKEGKTKNYIHQEIDVSEPIWNIAKKYISNKVLSQATPLPLNNPKSPRSSLFRTTKTFINPTLHNKSMESKPEFRKVTKTEDGGQIVRIPKAFAGELGINGGVVKMFCSGGRLIIEKVEG